MRLRQAISFFLIFLLSAFALAVDVALDGTHYPLRWGEREPIEDDLVKPYPPPIWANGYAACFKRGSQITLRLIRRQGDPEVQGWKVLYAELRSKVTGEVYWKHGESRMLGPNETYTLGSVPEFIEWAELRGSVIMMVGPPSEPEPGGSETSLLVQTIDRVTEIFVVLDEPKAPMDPAWVSVLRISCQWARGETTPDGAANMLTQRLWENGEYNGGYTAYTRYVCDGQGNCPSDASEYFYLKKFIESGFQGQCNDFADFLVCLINSIGAFQSLSQRTHPLGSGAFRTQVIDPAGSLQPDSVDWSYHQFCIHGNDVWDGCLAFVTGSPAGPPKKLSRDTIYYDGLVAYYIFGAWNPSPPSGFIPGVYALELPQWCSQTNRNAPCRGTGYGPNCPSP
jgi:hypothetical protein